jgi:hypothetical protein
MDFFGEAMTEAAKSNQIEAGRRQIGPLNPFKGQFSSAPARF